MALSSSSSSPSLSPLLLIRCSLFFVVAVAVLFPFSFSSSLLLFVVAIPDGGGIGDKNQGNSVGYFDDNNDSKGFIADSDDGIRIDNVNDEILNAARIDNGGGSMTLVMETTTTGAATTTVEEENGHVAEGKNDKSSLDGTVETSSSTSSAGNSVTGTDMAATNAPQSKTDGALLLGGEPCHQDRQQELKAVELILEQLTEEEREALSDPAMPVRHYRAVKLDVMKAVESIKETLKWRKEFDVDRIRIALEKTMANGGDDLDQEDKVMAETLRKENETGKIYIRGYDGEGRAFMYMRPGRENTFGQEDNNMRHLVWNLEKAIACTARKSKIIDQERRGSGDGHDADYVAPLEKINLVIDYHGFKLKNAPPMSTSRRTLDILQKHYPERLYRSYVVNPPLVFRTFWAIIKPFVDPLTKQKVVFCTGKKGLENISNACTAEGKKKLEESAGGLSPVRDFDSTEYCNLPLDHCFDE